MDPPALAERGRTGPSLWRNVSFLLMWSSVAASGFGDRLIQLAAEPMLGVGKPGASAAGISSGIMFFFFLPYMLLTVVGGYLADRLPRKWILLACDECRAAVLLVAFFMAAGLGTVGAIGPAHHWKVYLVMACTGVFAAIFNPAKQSTVPEIVPPQHLQPANAVLAGIGMIASMIGVSIGAVIIKKHSVALGIMVGAVSYGVSGMFFAFLRTTPGPAARADRSHGVLAQAAGALIYLRRHVAVRNLVVLNILFWTAGYIVYAALAALNRHHYGLPVDEYLTAKGNMMAVLGAGMLCGSFIVMWIRTRRESGFVAMSALVVAAVCMVAFGANRSYAMGMILAFAIGTAGGVFMICIDTLTQSITPNYLRGRVFGLRALLNTIAAVGVNFTIWRAPDADRLMIPALYVTAGVLLLVAVYGLFVQVTRGPLATRKLNVLWRANRLLFIVWHRVEWIGRQHVPRDGPVIMASNHTAGIDPFIMSTGVPRLIRWVMTGKYRFRLFEPVWRMVEPIVLSDDSSDLTKVRAMIRALQDGQVIGLFPEGKLQREVRELQPFQLGIGMIARRTGATIVPVWIRGTPQSRNMLVHFLKPSRSVVTYGPPYTPAPGESQEQIVAELRRRMVALGEQSAAAGSIDD